MDFKGKIEKVAIVCGGVVSELDWLKDNLVKYDYIIAADSGYDYCNKCGILPQLFIGDFDSVKSTVDSTIEKITLPSKKDNTDFEICLKYCHDNGIRSVDVFGASGGRPGHSFAAVFSALAFFCKGIDITFYSEKSKMLFVDNSGKFPKTDEYYSIFALKRDAVITLKGFEYPLTDYRLEVCSPLGVSNKIISEYGEISLRSGTVLVIIEK